MGPELPLILTESAEGGRNGSCAHCGAGCTAEDIAKLNVAQAKQVQAWLRSPVEAAAATAESGDGGDGSP